MVIRSAFPDRPKPPSPASATDRSNRIDPPAIAWAATPSAAMTDWLPESPTMPPAPAESPRLPARAGWHRAAGSNQRSAPFQRHTPRFARIASVRAADRAGARAPPQASPKPAPAAHRTRDSHHALSAKYRMPEAAPAASPESAKSIDLRTVSTTASAEAGTADRTATPPTTTKCAATTFRWRPHRNSPPLSYSASSRKKAGCRAHACPSAGIPVQPERTTPAPAEPGRQQAAPARSGHPEPDRSATAKKTLSANRKARCRSLGSRR
ncbi:hypothetical protein D3C78_886870 [compost metagenome]